MDEKGEEQSQGEVSLGRKMNHDMRAAWYPIAMAEEIKPGATEPFQSHILGDPIIIFRNPAGKACCLSDKCSHRSAPLSIGNVRQGNIECKYHGWQFAGDGSCVKIPALLSGKPIPKRANIPVYPCEERYGYIWIWPGPAEAADPTKIDREEDKYLSADATKPTGWVYYDLSLDLDIDHSLIVENLLDPAHVPFTHDGTIGKRADACGLEMRVEHKDGKLTGFGRKDITMPKNKNVPDMFFQFQPPCCVRLNVKLGPVGDMHQVNYLVPTRPGEVRAVLRIYYDFMHWQKLIPGVISYNRWLMTKIVYQDYELLHAQTKNLRLGARPWNQTIQVDSLPVQYRQWLRKALKQKPWFKGFSEDIEDIQACYQSIDAQCSSLNKRVANEASTFGFGDGFDPKKKEASKWGCGGLLVAGFMMGVVAALSLSWPIATS